MHAHINAFNTNYLQWTLLYIVFGLNYSACRGDMVNFQPTSVHEIQAT